MSVPVIKLLALWLARNMAAPMSSLDSPNRPDGRMRPYRFGPRAWGAVVFEQELSILFGREKAGSDGVDADAFRSPFAGKKMGEVDTAALAAE